MDVEKLLARLGRAVLAHEAEIAAHHRTIDLIRMVQNGELSIDRIVLSGYQWNIADKPPTPDGPLKEIVSADGETFQVCGEVEA